MFKEIIFLFSTYETFYLIKMFGELLKNNIHRLISVSDKM